MIDFNVAAMRNPELRHTGEHVLVRAYSLREIAEFYGISVKTMRKWLAPFEAEIGPRIGRYYTVAQVRIIFQRLGVPGTMLPDSSML